MQEVIRRGLPVALALLVAGATLLAASALASSASEAPKGGTLRWGTPGDVDFVDPALAYRDRSWPIGYATCAKLFNYPDAAGRAGTRLVPEVVDRYTVSKDGRTYTFTLRRTFRFHTGAGVTAQSFADALNRNAQPELGSPATTYMREIVGAQAVIEGKAQSIAGVDVLGRYRLRIRLTRPLGDFIARLTLPFFCPILPSTPATPKGIDNPAGSGPYYVAERVPNQRIVLRRNPHYRGARPANVDEIVWTINGNEECLAALEQNRQDYCYLGLFQFPRALADKYGINRPGGQFFVSPGLATWFVAFNHDRPAFTGPAQIPLKKAINFAIDRPELARAFGYLAGKRTDQILPPAVARPASIYPLEGADPATARTWLARAKLKPRRLVFYTDNSPQGVAVAQTVAFNLDQIGIAVEVKYFDINTLGDKIATRGEPYDLALVPWSADYADAAAFFVPLLGRGSTLGGVNLDDARVQRRLDQANRLTGEARRRAFAELDVDLMRANPPWAPFLHIQRRTVVSRAAGCVVVNPIYGFEIAAACKK